MQCTRGSYIIYIYIYIYIYICGTLPNIVIIGERDNALNHTVARDILNNLEGFHFMILQA